MTLDTSHPNPWLYAGILEIREWDWLPSRVERWDGEIVSIGTGDRVLLLRTPAYSQVVEVVARKTVAA